MSERSRQLKKKKEQERKNEEEAAKDIDSEEEEQRNKDFFESMVYWKFEQANKKSTKDLLENQEKKEIRKKMMG